jgi:hypothetical protein
MGVGWVAALGTFLGQVFGLFGGGSTPELPRKLQHGPNNLYPEVTAIRIDFTPGENSAVASDRPAGRGMMPGVQLVAFSFPYGLPANIALGGGNCGLVGGTAGGALGALGGGGVGSFVFGGIGAAAGNYAGQLVCHNGCAGTANCNEEKMLQDYYKHHPNPSPPERPLAR